MIETKTPTEKELKELRLFEMTGKKLKLDELEIKKKEKAEREEIKRQEREAKKEQKKAEILNIENLAVRKKGGFYLSKDISDNDMARALRRLTMRKTFNFLSSDFQTLNPAEMDLYSKLLVKLAGSVLPRIQEITGADGEELTIHISKEIAEKNNIIEAQAIEATQHVVDSVINDGMNEDDDD